MSIVFVLGRALPFAGAAWVRISYFARTWSKSHTGIEIIGAFTAKSIGKRGSVLQDPLLLRNILPSINKNGAFWFALNYLLSFLSFMFYLLIRRPGIVIISVPPGDIGLGTMHACSLTRTRYIVDYRDQWEHYLLRFHKPMKLVLPLLSFIHYRKSLGVVTATPNYIPDFEKNGILHLGTIWNGADLHIFKPVIHIPKEKFTVVYVGGIGSYYRIDIVVKAISLLIFEFDIDIELVIAGAGEINHIQKLSEKLKITDKIRYLGSIASNIELARIIATSDVGIIPYDDNPLWLNTIPAKFFEYCACGIPIIASTHQSSLLAKLIDQYQIGYHVEPLDSGQLAHRLHQLYLNEESRIEFGNSARALIESKYNRYNSSKEFLSIVESFLLES